jgi:hypothetical protein
MELVLQKQSNQLAQSGNSPMGGSGAGMGSGGNPAAALIGSLQDLTSGIRKLVTAVQFNTRALGNVPSSSGGDGKGLENEIEGNRSRDAQTQLLFAIERNTRGGDKKDDKDDKKKSDWSFLDYIKGFGIAIAATLGAIAGMFAAQFKVMKFFGEKIVDAIRWVGKTLMKFANFLDDLLLDGAIQKKFKQIATFVEELVGGLKQRIGNIGKSIGEFFEEAGKQFKKMFSFLEESDIGKRIKSVITSVQESLMGLWKTIKGVFSGLGEEGIIGKIFKSIGNFFTDVGAYFGKLSGVFGTVFRAFTKIFFWVGIVMGIFDTVTGAIDGYNKDGVLGGIKGAITGLINGVFLSFADLVKDMASWLLEKLGFKQAAAFLDSFSFQDLFTKMVDKVFDVILNPIKYITDAFDKLDLKALIFEPISKAWTFLNESLGGIPQKIVDNIKLYIMDPLSAAFAPVVDMFKNMAAKVIEFFSTFKIPGVEVTIPYVNKTFGIGPWYPFKSNAKPADAAGVAPQGTSAGTPAASAPQGTSAGTPAAANASRAEFAKTDPRLAAPAPADASNVTNASKTNADTAATRSIAPASGSNTIVNAPSNVMNKTTSVMRPSIRNTEPSVSTYLRSRLVT